MYLSPAQTTKSYDAADGTNTTIGALQLQNVLIVTSAKGETGKLQGIAANNGESAMKLVISTGKKNTTLTIPAETAVRLDGKRSADTKSTVSPVSVPSVAAAPGESQKVIFSTKASGATQVQVPVMLDQYPYGKASPEHGTFTTPPNTETEEPPA